MQLAKVAVARDFLDGSKRDASPRHCRQAGPTKAMAGCAVYADVLKGFCEDIVGANTANVLVGVIRRREKPGRGLRHLVEDLLVAGQLFAQLRVDWYVAVDGIFLF